jgi:hypothetical protein
MMKRKARKMKERDREKAQMKEEGDRTKKSTKYRNMEEKIENLTS